MTNSELLLVIACVLFVVAAVVRLGARAFDGALVAAGFAAVALAFVIT